MHDQSVIDEKQSQYEKDKSAFGGLSPKAQQATDKIAGGLFFARKAFVGGGKVVAGVIEGAFNVVFRLPYVFLKRVAVRAANETVRGIKLAVHAGAFCARGLLSFDKSDKSAGWQDKLLRWEKNTAAKIDKVWHDTKETLNKGIRKTHDFLEYYGALGLYRATEWILNPHTPSGKPLMGNEKLNRIVGATVACGLFVYLAFEVSKIAVLAKMWHLKFAKSIMTDTAPMYIKLLKQGMFHPMLTAGVTAVKFLTLPVIAASRQAIKSTPFTQGIAYQYNVRLKALEEKKQMEQKRAPYAFIQDFVAHIVEKASPEFYKARLGHYRRFEQEGREIVIPEIPQKEAAGILVPPELTDTFKKAKEPAVSVQVLPKNAGLQAPRHRIM